MSPEVPPNTWFEDHGDGTATVTLRLEGRPGWMLRAHVVDEDGQAVIDKLTIERGDPMGDFAEHLGLRIGSQPPPVPGGISARLLREIQVGTVIQQANAWIAAKVPTLPTLPRPSRTGRLTDRDHAVWAARYVRLLQRGSRQPIADLAQQYGEPRARVRDLIHTCRSRGLLPHATSGRASGQLTDKAMGLLSIAHEHDEKEPEEEQ